MARLSFCFFVFILCLPSLLTASENQEIPTPESIIGFKPGTDFKLADWEMILRYFNALDQASNRVSTIKIGKSSENRDMIFVIITSPENLARINKIKENLSLLADPRRIKPKEAEALIAQTPSMFFVGCSQHASEIGATQTSMEIAHKLASSQAPEDLMILENVVLLMAPSLNPDGHQMICDWYYKNLGTPFEGGYMPWLYHKYVGHDINRDWAINTQVETKLVSRLLYNEWFPQVVIDAHQMGKTGPRMFIPPYRDPINPNIDPMLDHELTLLTAQMRLDLTLAGHKGVITNAMFDEWLIGYFSSVPSRHNMVAQLIEMASVNIASPVFLRARDLRGSRGNKYGRLSNFPNPWEGGWWRLRHIVEYVDVAVRSGLGLVARNRELFLRNFYRMGLSQINKGINEPPFAYVIPPDQRDPGTAWKMVQILKLGGVDVHEAQAPFEVDEIPYPKGSWVVLMAQPFRAFAKDLLETQTYPNIKLVSDAPPERPYDVTGWTLPMVMDVKTVEVINPFKADLSPLTAPPVEEVVNLDEPGKYLIIDRGQNNAFILVNRLLAGQKEVFSVTAPCKIKETEIPDGSFVVPINDNFNALNAQLKELGLRAFQADHVENMFRLKPYRLGLYKPWTASMDEGWTRWVLEQFEFKFKSVHDEEFRAGNLRRRYDALILPDLRASSIISGVREGSLPKKYTGGLSAKGVFHLRDFVRDGGVIIGIDSSCAFLIDVLELPVNDLSLDRKKDKRLSCPGSVLRINTNNSHPVCWGMKPSTAIVFSSSPYFELDKKIKNNPVTVVGSYPKYNPLLSGWIENEESLFDKAAIIEAPFEKGKAILIGFRCQFRAQPHGTFKLLFNSILYATQTFN